MEIADQLSDRVAIIDHGKLLVLGTPENLKDRVGKGDIMEIALYDEAKNKRAREALEGMEGIQEVTEIKGRIVVRALDAANKFPKIFASLERIEARVLDVSLRRNSLEDVFITLTGRGLRE
jgi:ABC-2 type transport system ATP-binding protein